MPPLLETPPFLRKSSQSRGNCCAAEWRFPIHQRGGEFPADGYICKDGNRASEEMEMAWKAPKIVEVPVGMEINMYACAARK